MSQPESEIPSQSPENASQRPRGRTNLALGVILLLVGSIILASNLGIVIPYDWWSFWPWVLIALGGLQIAMPDRLTNGRGGFWLLVVGIYGAVSMHELFGLHWGNAWPIFIIALGLRVILGGMFRRL
jgi:hypothetical protein